MHKSKLGGISIDCEDTDLKVAAEFWSQALGLTKAGETHPNYASFKPIAGGLTVEVQNVSHPSRVHMDIETDDIQADIKRLENLGATVVSKVKTWYVMEAPTGQRFCIVEAQAENFDKEANVWD